MDVKLKTISKLKKRESINDSSSKYEKKVSEKPQEVKRKSMILDFKDLQDCKKWLFKDQRYSIEDFSNIKVKANPLDHRSFSVN